MFELVPKISNYLICFLMILLNLPVYEYNVKNIDGKTYVFDLIRKKYVVLTPEEWVRQHFVNYMTNHLNYPKTLIRTETGLKYNTRSKRTDIVLYDRIGKPWMVVECKSTEQKINQLTANQVAVYNAAIKAKYIALTNGLVHLCWEVDHDKKTTLLLESFPNY